MSSGGRNSVDKRWQRAWGRIAESGDVELFALACLVASKALRQPEPTRKKDKRQRTVNKK